MLNPYQDILKGPCLIEHDFDVVGTSHRRTSLFMYDLAIYLVCTMEKDRGDDGSCHYLNFN